MSKAWEYHFFDEDEGAMIFFADNRTEARKIAYDFDAQYISYINIRVIRVPELDYLNHEQGYVMDWSNHDDRKAMVKMGMFCLDNPSPIYMDVCEECGEKEFCSAYEKEINKCTS